MYSNKQDLEVSFDRHLPRRRRESSLRDASFRWKKKRIESFSRDQIIHQIPCDERERKRQSRRVWEKIALLKEPESIVNIWCWKCFRNLAKSQTAPISFWRWLNLCSLSSVCNFLKSCFEDLAMALSFGWDWETRLQCKYGGNKVLVS